MTNAAVITIEKSAYCDIIVPIGRKLSEDFGYPLIERATIYLREQLGVSVDKTELLRFDHTQESCKEYLKGRVELTEEMAEYHKKVCGHDIYTFKSTILVMETRGMHGKTQQSTKDAL